MQYRKPIITEDLGEVLPIRVTEVVPGHQYIIANRHTAGFEDIKFSKFLTYKQMIEQGLPQDFIDSIVPEAEKHQDNCCVYLVSEGVFTQDVIETLIKRVNFQYGTFNNGFYTAAIKALEIAKLQYELFTIVRQQFGFYHIPFTIEKFIEAIENKSQMEVNGHRDLINTFLEFDDQDRSWITKEDLVNKIVAKQKVKSLLNDPA